MRSTRIKFQRQIWNGKECDRHEEEKDKKSADQTHTEGTGGRLEKISAREPVPHFDNRLCIGNVPVSYTHLDVYKRQILSQLFRGFTKVIAEYDEIDVQVLSDAFEKAVETAYKAVMKPKEGTILTVAKGLSLIHIYLRSVPRYGRMARQCADTHRAGTGNDFHRDLYP